VSDLEEKRIENMQRNAEKLRELGFFTEPEPKPDPALTMYVVTILKYPQD
jgi:hypothetical protein